MADRRPLVAGALIGFLTFKPQLGLLLPTVLVASGRWRMIAGACGSALGLFAVSWMMVGAHGWSLFYQGLQFQREMFRYGSGPWLFISPSPLLVAARAGLSWGVAYGIQIGIGIAMAIIVFIRFYNQRNRTIAPMDIVILAAAGFLVSPYSFNYDMGSLAVALILASQDQPDLDADPAWRWGVFALRGAPVLMTFAGYYAYHVHMSHLPPVGAALVMIGFVLVLTAARRSPATSLSFSSGSTRTGFDPE